MSKVPISLIIDDGGVVNMYHYHDLTHKHEQLVPPAFTMEFGNVCRKYGVRGKFSVVPIPAGLGRLDEKNKVNGVDPAQIDSFVRICKKYIMPDFSITPEILTHFLAWNLKRSCNMQMCEDVYFSHLTAEEIADYVALSLTILNNLGLNPTGVTSPWYTGGDNEDNYAKGIGMAFKRVFNKESCYYFMHTDDHIRKPTVMCDTPESGRVVTIPATCNVDPFWDTQNPIPVAKAHRNVRKLIDYYITADGRSGKFRELYEENRPMVFYTHWQSLYSDGRGIGLEGLDALCTRLKKVFGSDIGWTKFEDLNWD